MAQDALVNLGAFGLQVAAIVAAATALLWVLRIGPAGTRYVCWRVVLVVSLAMPPILHRTAPTELMRQGSVAVDRADDGDGSVDVTTGSSPARAVAGGSSIPWGGMAAAVILLGAVVRGAWLMACLLKLRMLRRRGEPVSDPEYDDIQRTLGTSAGIRSVTGLAQPATFGLWRPVVLLPDTVRNAPAALRRAVVTHELFHVQRRDWLWLLSEEALRALLWFHPAIAWVTSRIQLAREELVDELTVLATGNRKAYIEALLAFAEGEGVRPAPAFARRRQLFTRIVRLSKEPSMSSPRIVVSAAAVIVIALSAGWYTSSAFPMVYASSSDSVAPTSAVPSPPLLMLTVPRDQADRMPSFQDQRASSSAGVQSAQGPRSGGASRPGPRAVQTPAGEGRIKPITPENPIPRRLASTPIPYPAQLRGSGYRGTVMVRVTLGASGTVDEVQRTYANVMADSSSVDRGTAATVFFDAVAGAVRQWRYQSPAEPPIAFYVNARFDSEGDAAATQGDTPLMIVSREPATRGPQTPSGLVSPSGQPPVRVGGNIRPPQKIRDVAPVYPAAAREARVQGVVILEALIDEQGRVADARVLRSIPLLDQAALDAIKQWEFTPTLLNGAPVPAFMTMTMLFSLPPD